MQDMRRAHQIFYEVLDKTKQENIILRFVTVNSIKRSRSRKDLFLKTVNHKIFYA
jgi:hypothetical protein